ncbi:hydroxyacid dehydrogenase [Bradyrhizobium sp. NP1]|nr:hydroxyacid dehydrogenase [Bradyrhizobium sp. NP1]WJR82074.1 hydroxyacid dehydrogenase [Bradyrhizobium sp. NP1]
MHPDGVALLEPVAEVRVAPEPSGEALRRVLPEAEFLVVRTPLPADLLAMPHQLRGIVRHGTGLDMIPVAAATRQGIPVANVPGANAQAVAEYVVGSFFQLARRFSALDHTLRKAGWPASRKLSENAIELAGRTVGIIGVGYIGSRIARICDAGLGMTVLGYQPRTTDFPEYVRSVQIDELLAQSDFVTLNCPLLPDTRHLIDARRIGLMKRTAFLVNAARGEIVDENVLATALREHAIAGAAVDVYAEQPLAPSHPFLTLDNVLLTPHAASLTRESGRQMSVGTARRLLQLMKGERPLNLVNPEVWATWPYRL